MDFGSTPDADLSLNDQSQGANFIGAMATAPAAVPGEVLQDYLAVAPAAPAPVRDVSIGAGAKVRQELLPDPLKIEDWKKEPSGIIRLYFVFRSQFEQIVANGGVKDLAGNKEGYLAGVKVG
jgi:hypothetical protein